jgi:hypothetical protein
MQKSVRSPSFSPSSPEPNFDGFFAGSVGPAGQAVVAVACVLSIVIVAIPIGIISWGWEPNVRRFERYQQREKILIRQQAEALLQEALDGGLDIEDGDDNTEDASDDEPTGDVSTSGVTPRTRLSSSLRGVLDSHSPRIPITRRPQSKNPFFSRGDSAEDLASSPAGVFRSRGGGHSCPTCHRPY